MVTHEHSLVKQFRHRIVEINSGAGCCGQRAVPAEASRFKCEGRGLHNEGQGTSAIFLREGIRMSGANRTMTIASIGVLIACAF